jgi:hypothetical protein
VLHSYKCTIGRKLVDNKILYRYECTNYKIFHSVVFTIGRKLVEIDLREFTAFHQLNLEDQV